MKKNFGWIAGVMLAMFIVVSTAPAETMTGATGSKDGFYNKGLFNTFNGFVKRYSDGEMDCERYDDKGTDGTIHNIKLVGKGDADFGFIQLGGAVVEPNDNVEVIAPIMWEIGHLVVGKKGKVSDAGDLESKKGYSLGLNTRSGSAVTWNVFTKVDKDYKRANVTDFPRITRAISAITNGNLDSYFFVSGPGTDAIKRVLRTDSVKFADCWDGDFDEFEFNGKPLYRKIKVGKKEGYDRKFVTVAVPAVVIANKKFLEENPEAYDVLFDAAAATFNYIKGAKKLKYYPKN